LFSIVYYKCSEVFTAAPHHRTAQTRKGSKCTQPSESSATLIAHPVLSTKRQTAGQTDRQTCTRGDRQTPGLTKPPIFWKYTYVDIRTAKTIKADCQSVSAMAWATTQLIDTPGLMHPQHKKRPSQITKRPPPHATQRHPHINKSAAEETHSSVCLSVCRLCK